VIPLSPTEFQKQILAFSNYVKNNPFTRPPTYNELVEIFIENGFSTVLNYIRYPYTYKLDGPRSEQYCRRLIFALHRLVMDTLQGTELIPNLSLFFYFTSYSCGEVTQRLGGCFSAPTIRNRIRSILENRSEKVVGRLAEFIKKNQVLIFLMDDFQRTMRNKLKKDASLEAVYSNSTKLFGVGRPDTNCLATIDFIHPLLQHDLSQTTSVVLTLLRQEAAWETLFSNVILPLVPSPTKWSGSRSIKNYRLLNMPAEPVKSFMDVINGLLDFHHYYNLALSQAKKNKSTTPIFLCADFPLFKSYVQLIYLLRPHDEAVTAESILLSTFPGRIPVASCLPKLMSLRQFFRNAVPLPAQFHCMQSAVKGLYFCGFRLLFRPAARAITRKTSLTAQLPFAVVEKHMKIILKALNQSCLPNLLETTAETAVDPYIFFLAHFYNYMIPMALAGQEMYRREARTLSSLKLYAARMILFFAECGKLHYRSCMVYLLTQLQHFEQNQASVNSYLVRKIGDINEVAIEYYHALICSFTPPNCTPQKVSECAEVLDECTDELQDVKKYLFGTQKTKYRASATFDCEDPETASTIDHVSEVFDEIIQGVQMRTNYRKPREFLADIFAHVSTGEMFYSSSVFDYVECRLLGMGYVPLCASVCMNCRRCLSTRRSDCFLPLCDSCRHVCSESCPKDREYIELVHLCAGCGIPIYREEALAALDYSEESPPQSACFAKSCAHIFCSRCLTDYEPPCKRCILVQEQCVVDAVQRATEVFSVTPGSSSWARLRKILTMDRTEPGIPECGESQGEFYEYAESDDEDSARVLTDFFSNSEVTNVEYAVAQLFDEMRLKFVESSAPEAPPLESSFDLQVDFMRLTSTASKKLKVMHKSVFPNRLELPHLKKRTRRASGRSL